MSISTLESELKYKPSSFSPIPGLSYRLRQEKAVTGTIKHYGEKWPIASGDYEGDEHSLVNLLQVPLSDKYSLGHKLGDLIERALQTKPKENPVVVLDVGGGAGVTWHKTASLFKSEISRGRVVFAVSNLVWDRKQFRQCSNDINLRIEPYEDAQGFVHSVISNFRGLRKKVVTLPNGDIISLKGNVDLVHECMSVSTWSHAPELDIPAIAKLLSQYGTYLIAPRNRPLSYDQKDKTELYQRQSALRHAYNLLQTTFNLRRIREVEAGQYKGSEILYTIFRQPDAPQIKI